MISRKDGLSVVINPYAQRGKGRGLLFAPASTITASEINDMTIYGRGLIACCVSEERAVELELGGMVGSIDRAGIPKYFASVEAYQCTSAGISAADRALTLRVLGNENSSPADLVSPRHIIPCTPPPFGR